MDEGWQILKEIELIDTISPDEFWNGISVWIERPHLLNRRLIGAELLETRSVLETSEWKTDLADTLLKLFANENLTLETFNQLLQHDYISPESIKLNESVKKSITDKAKEGVSNILFIRNLLSKNMKLYQDMSEVFLLDYYNCCITFYPMCSPISMYPLSPTFPYRIQLIDKKIILDVFQKFLKEKDSNISKSETWLASEVLPKIHKWCIYQPSGFILPSLNLISVSKYKSNLHKLKEKYGKLYVDIWPSYNSTDPYKFVYEDISICAYLITLWEEERAKLGYSQKQKFLDIGCGNGLLVDILSSEGYDGIGIDLRKRKIWNAFQSKDKLIEMAVNPTYVFPEYDWIIGNHPDELTPWIPVIAARSSYNMKIFLMPCCYYTFNGKYSYCDAGLTRYQSYLKFVQKICETLGFVVKQDKLRIPSTKRICFVSTGRSYEEKEHHEKDILGSDLMQNELKIPSIELNNSILLKKPKFYKSLTAQELAFDFKHREPVQPIRNCTDLDKKIINDIVLAVVKFLLSSEVIKPIEHDKKITYWNVGGKTTLNDIIKILNPKWLSCLKKQNGGLQTLLRNHKNIFQIENNWIQIRVPSKDPCQDSVGCDIYIDKRKFTSKYKTKICFFHFNHPQGCPLPSSDCFYSHEKLN